MKFENIYSQRRVGSNNILIGTRLGFQRDYDRLIFSSSFRRLQDKIQVFPISDTALVHTRLTHTLEVASVGRSIATIVGGEIGKKFSANSDVYEFYCFQLADVIAAACLAHDIGNPPFGHSGEKAISDYFIENSNLLIDGRPLKDFFTETEWKDLTSFDGNANAVRILAHQFRGRFKGGFGLTFTTIASILKYPCESVAVDKRFNHRKKYGFFQTEKETVLDIMRNLGMIEENNELGVFKRHPFVYLVEAADEICFTLTDFEDAYRLGIITKTEVEEAFMVAIHRLAKDGAEQTYAYYRAIEDTNEGIAFLRARIINLLVNKSAEVFFEYQDDILNGSFDETLIGNLEKKFAALETIHEISLQKIYKHDTVAQIAIRGYNIMSEILSLFVPALLKEKPSHKDERVLDLFPYQFTEFEFSISKYERVMNALDYVSGMTEKYATELCKSLKGTIAEEAKAQKSSEMERRKDDYDLAISFAGEDREIAEEIANKMKNLGYSIFYDRFNKANLWGKDLYTHLNDVYGNKATFCLMIISRNYAQKSWTNHERTAVQAKAFKQNEEYILPLRLDNTEIPGLNVTVGYVDYIQTGFEETISLLETKIKEKSGRNQTQ